MSLYYINIHTVLYKVILSCRYTIGENRDPFSRTRSRSPLGFPKQSVRGPFERDARTESSEVCCGPSLHLFARYYTCTCNSQFIVLTTAVVLSSGFICFFICNSMWRSCLARVIPESRWIEQGHLSLAYGCTQVPRMELFAIVQILWSLFNGFASVISIRFAPEFQMLGWLLV